MTNSNQTPNRLIDEKSPYLLQHAYNPVDWFPWGEKAFEKAKTEDKPIFLSIGYSTCHWCHVMERESFENEAIAKIMNDHYISIKVDKEERPDIDSIYMRVCQAYTGSGGWPTSIFMTPEQKPFYAATYFPPTQFIQMLDTIHYNWRENRENLIRNSEKLIHHINTDPKHTAKNDADLAQNAFSMFSRTFDKEYGGFGNAPKFPSPQNLLFLLGYAESSGNKRALEMAEQTLISMYKGGIFDHIGYGFSRYSTDRFWLAPHFEKMLYDNALLAMAYLTTFEQTGNRLYRSVAEKIFIYLQREMANGQGGFFSAQDADSDGIEGKYYTLMPDEVIDVLGKADAERLNQYYDITEQGNFEGKNIPNLIKQSPPFNCMEELLPKLYEYRKSRTTLHRDDKILTAWNSLTLWAYATAYRVLGDDQYRKTALLLVQFIENQLADGDVLYVSVTDGKRGEKGFLDDYAFYILALIALYEATFDEQYLKRALELNDRVVEYFFDMDEGGFYFYASDSEALIMRPKENYDGAIPSGNSVMAYNLDRLAKLTKDERLYKLAEKQMEYMSAQASEYPAGFCFYLLSTLPTRDIVCVLKDKNDMGKFAVKSRDVMRVFDKPTEGYDFVNDKTTFYVCEMNRCFAPTNEN